MAKLKAWQASASTESSPEPSATADEIARVAYELWEHRGRAHGHDFEDWLEAERTVRARRHRR